MCVCGFNVMAMTLVMGRHLVGAKWERFLAEKTRNSGSGRHWHTLPHRHLLLYRLSLWILSAS